MDSAATVEFPAIADGPASTADARQAASVRGKLELREVIMERISELIRDFILREFLAGEDPRELTDRTPLITGGILDSISMLKLVTFIEDRFGIVIEAHEAGVDHLDSIDRISALVAAKQDGA
jgi:acyl carrier protein